MQTSHYHIFSLPLELLDSLTPQSKSGPRACAICNGITFLDVNEQRAHFRSDWHRYNVKTRLNGGKTVSEPTFAQLVEGLEDSLSGSESSDTDDDEDSDAVNTLITLPDSSAKSSPITALAWFHLPPSTQIGVYRTIFPLRTEQGLYLEELRRLQAKPSRGRTWAIPEEDEPDEEVQGRKKKPKRPKPDTEVILHKTFHRYTKNRGGSQSANDNAKGPAKSAGALLRRYGEQALRDVYRTSVLAPRGAEDIEECELIWIRANTSNRRIFYDFEDAPFSKNDERLRTFPFPTRRPTQSEIARCLLELTRPKISHFTEDELRAQDEAYLASLPKPKPVPTIIQQAQPEKPKLSKLSKEEQALQEKWNRLLEMVVKGRLEPLKTFLERERETIGGVDTRIPEWTGEKKATIFQVAVHSGHEDLIQWLLEEARADPTVPVPSTRPDNTEDVNEEGIKSDASDPSRPLASGSHRVAYDLARTRPIRDIFRRCAAAHPDWWDWFDAAHVPSGLSQEMEEEHEEKKKARKKGLKDKERDHSQTPPAESKPLVKDGHASNSAARRLGGASGASEAVAGLTPEMMAKVERERRARAAEARLKGLGIR
ncbi:hypothetical protein CPB84DRAFT_1780198 [Gymnopilus junonius]|uniref:VLRF1 domain-containing protein n=1 Tax=Gymnopilus junonius TaxID=109634 RepID=A0A9P5TMW9_GYMJU|nr:hypothetical protein CPB84DRAFT_1780198 [Gymnopilus junonius]